MAGDTNRDRSVEKALPGVMRRAGGPRPEPAEGPGSSACLEAETLAAWSEGALPASETVAIERHVADCARCQALVAVFAKTEPVAAAPPPQRAWSLRWFLPLAAGTAAVATLIWIGRPDTPATPVSQNARVEAPAAEPPAAPASAPTAPAAANPEVVRLKPDTTSAKKNTATAKNSPLRQTAVTVPSAAPVEAQPLPPPPAPSAPPTTPPPPPPSPPPVTGDRSVQVQAAPLPPPAPEPALLRMALAPVTLISEFTAGAGRQAMESVAELVPTTATAARGGQGRGGVAGGGAGRGGGGAPAAKAVRSPPPLPPPPPLPATRWRIFSDGHVERSTSNGSSWQPVATDPPAFITAGAAPGGGVCWLVGRAGTVLLSRNDGAIFTRVTSPAPVTLAAIRSTGPLDATVTAADGRTFTTTDGGVTWQ